MLLAIFLLALGLHGRPQRVGHVELGLCLGPGCLVRQFMVSDLRVELTDTLFSINDSQSSSFRVVGLLMTRRDGWVRRDSYLCLDLASRRCLVTLVTDGESADNRVVVSYPGVVTVYHLSIHVVRSGAFSLPSPKTTAMIIAISESEILGTPNDQELGEAVRGKYYEARARMNDRCVLCGKVSPYGPSDHIMSRVGYVEGAGQGCFQPSVCGRSGS